MTHGPLRYSAYGNTTKRSKITEVLTHLQIYKVKRKIRSWMQVFFPHGNSFIVICDIWNIFCANWEFTSQNILTVVLIVFLCLFWQYTLFFSQNNWKEKEINLMISVIKHYLIFEIIPFEIWVNWKAFLLFKLFLNSKQVNHAHNKKFK